MVALGDLERDDFWQEGADVEPGDNEFGQDPSSRWFVSYDVYLVDDRRRAVGSRHWAGMDSFFMQYSICSPTMKIDPPADLADQLTIAVVQNRFDERAAVAQLQGWLGGLGPLPADTLVARLKQKLYFLPKGRRADTRKA